MEYKASRAGKETFRMRGEQRPAADAIPMKKAPAQGRGFQDVTSGSVQYVDQYLATTGPPKLNL